ncbi:MAG: helix-turn-helix domain-containing protein [Clostridia bacterium]|jgi:transcriptional regulator with XRE-family HTH domain|nr:helix-turn-helix domain-containing protein [Clostridia bacterium]
MKSPIKQHREKQGLKQLDLALLLQVSEMQVSHWERPSRIPPDRIIARLAEIFKVEAETLKQGLVSYLEEKREVLRRKVGA